MSRKRLGRLQRAATIVPLALLSMAWTASVYGIGGASAPLRADEETITEGVSVPDEAIDDPASLTNPGSLTNGNSAGVVAAASTNEIPSAALAAYQRSETIINSAKTSCHLTWQLIAAIGRVESDHGRVGGSVLDNEGVARPGIFGKPLNGTKGTKAIADSDAGQLDNDTRWDRAVGPMQFIPSTWQVVGVDGDNDSERNPQDIDDAALATAVYLCSGSDDLSTLTGQRAAVYRYNNSQTYVDLVLEIMAAYLEGDFTTIPNNTLASPGYIVPDGYGNIPGLPDDNGGGGSSDGGSDIGGGDGVNPGGNDGGGENPGGENPGGENPGGENPGGENPGGENPGGDGDNDGNPDLTDPDSNNVPDTGVPQVDDTTEQLVDGLLGVLDLSVLGKLDVQLKCVAAYPLNVSKQQACLASYGF